MALGKMKTFKSRTARITPAGDSCDGASRPRVALYALRLNLSKRGVGASIGVKGLRTGIDATGKPYVAGGRGGIYFRERLPVGDTDRTQQERPPRNGSATLGWIVAAVLAVIVLLLLAAR